MHPLRHSASLPSLPSTGSFLGPGPPLPPSNATPSQPSSPAYPRPSPTTHHAQHHSISSTLSTLFPPPRLSSPPPPSSSALYSFPSSLIAPPPFFSRVEPSLYRCASFAPFHYPFLLALRLSAVVAVSPEPIPSSVLHFFHQQRIHVHFLHHPHSSHHSHGHAPPHTAPSHPPSAPGLLTPSAVKSALEYVLHGAHHPLLLLSSARCSPDLCLLVGCLRRLQGWCYASVVEEYERWMAGSGEVLLDSGRLWLDEVALETTRWDEEVHVEAERQVRWWRETLERLRRKHEYRRRKERAALRPQHEQQRQQRAGQREQRRREVQGEREALQAGAMQAEDEARQAAYERRVMERLRVESEEDEREAADEEESARRDAAHADEDLSLDRVLFSNPQWRVISEGVKFDKVASIIEDDED